MCFIVNNSFSKANEVVPQFELTLIILDEIGCLVQYPHLCHAQVTEVARILSHSMISKHNVCEDG